jgi:hypothetical protein
VPASLLKFHDKGYTSKAMRALEASRLANNFPDPQIEKIVLVRRP